MQLTLMLSLATYIWWWWWPWEQCCHWLPFKYIYLSILKTSQNVSKIVCLLSACDSSPNWSSSILSFICNNHLSSKGFSETEKCRLADAIRSQHGDRLKWMMMHFMLILQGHPERVAKVNKLWKSQFSNKFSFLNCSWKKSSDKLLPHFIQISQKCF